MKKIKLLISKILILTLILGNFSFLATKTYAKGESLDFSSSQDINMEKVDFNNNKLKIDGIIVRLNKTKGLKTSILSLLSKNGLEVFDSIDNKNISLLKITDKNISIEKTIENLKNDGRFDLVQPNFVYNIASIDSNDTFKDNQWGLYNYGQTIQSKILIVGKDISFDKTIKIFSGNTNSGVIVAVLDSGIAYNHPDLINQMWDGTNCRDENGVFLGGCNHGYDYADNDKNPIGEYEIHGTHVAGILAAQMNNGTGVIGVNPNVKIMSLRMGDSSFSSLSVIKSIYFAKENGAKIINASVGLGGSLYVDKIQYEAIKAFTDSGGLFIAAAGNEGTNNDDINTRFFPASFGITNYVDSNGYLTGSYASGGSILTGIINLISVSATDNTDAKASFSNYGLQTVDISAPGVGIYSTVLGDITYFKQSLTGSTILFETGGIDNNWGLDLGFLRTDIAYPYATGSDTYIEKQVDLSGVNAPVLNFSVWCDSGKTGTGYDNYSTDYLSLSFSTGGSFEVIDKYNYTSSSLTNYLGGGYYDAFSIPLKSYTSSNFKFRFSWHSDDIEDPENGCFIWNALDLSGKDYGESNSYKYNQGTSMATPFVSGLASLLWGYKPNFSALNIKNAITQNGDLISTMSGKSITGKRINSYLSLLSLMDVGNISNFKIYKDNSKISELLSGSFSNSLNPYFEWQDDVGIESLSGYIFQVKNSSGVIISNESTLNKFYSGFTFPSEGIYNFSLYEELINGKTGAISSIENISYDITSPIFSKLSNLDGEKFTISNLAFSGLLSDNAIQKEILLNGTGVTLNSSGIFSKNITLNPGLNNILLEARDLAGNYTSTGINFIRIGNAQKVTSSIYGTGSIRFEFDTEFAGTGFILYGTGNLTNIFTGTYGLKNIIDLPYTSDNTIYYYKAFYINNGYESLYSDTGSIITPKNVLLQNLTGSLSFTGNINIIDSTGTGAKFLGTGTIKLYSNSGSSYIDIPKYGLEVFSLSGVWDGIIESPHITISTGNLSSSGFSRINDLTFKIGSDSDSLTFSGGLIDVYLDVGNTYNGKILKIYRSEDNQKSFTYLSDCVVSLGICTFKTNKFSDFALLEPIIIDYLPDNFMFTSINDAETSTLYTSNFVTITGMNFSTGITITTGSLQINGVDVGNSGVVNSGSIISIKLYSSSLNNTLSTSTISIGGYTTTFSINTKSIVNSGGSSGGGGGGPVLICLDRQLVCKSYLKGFVYFRKVGINCNGGNVGKTCGISTPIVSLSGITNSGKILIGIKQAVETQTKTILDFNKQLESAKKVLEKTKTGNIFINNFDKQVLLIKKGDIGKLLNNFKKINNNIYTKENLSYMEAKLRIKLDLINEEEKNYQIIQNKRKILKKYSKKQQNEKF